MNSRPALIHPLTLMQIALALFFGISGLLFLTSHNAANAEINRAFARLVGTHDTLNIVIAIVQFIAGVILIVGLFAFVPVRTMTFAGFAILVLWIIQIIMAHFAYNFLQPDFIPWLYRLSWDLIVLAGLWSITWRTYT